MNKTALIGVVAAEAALTKKETKKAVDAFIRTVENAMEKGDKVTLTGFGSFSIIRKSARKGINPKTKLPVIIPARKAVKFKPGTEFIGYVK
jgi:DNA-binding protein HU-beta